MSIDKTLRQYSEPSYNEKRELAKRLFAVCDIKPNPDSELVELVYSAAQCNTEEGLTTFLEKHKRFDGPVTMMETGEKVEHWDLRASLKLVPDYMKAAQDAGLSYEQANDVVWHAMDSDPYEFNDPEDVIQLLTKLYRQAEARDLDFASELDEFKDMIELTAKYGIMRGALYGFTHTTRMGFSVPQSCRMFSKLADADGHLAGYVIGHFNEAMKTLNIADVDPDLVETTFDLLGGERPYYNASRFGFFKELISLGCQSFSVTPAEMIQKLVDYASKKKGRKSLGIDSGIKSLSTELAKTDDAESALPARSVDDYFVAVEGPLEVAALPYRTQRTFNDGLRDLENIATASSRKWEEIGQGTWVFDSEKSIWYSFGGHTELEMGKVRHVFIPYDFSKLSSSPIIAKVNAEEYEIMISPHDDDLSVPSLRKKITKFLSGTPSGADFHVLAGMIEQATNPINPQMYIIHSSGITEVGFRNDVSALKEMGEKSRDLRDQAMIKFPAVNYYLMHGDRENNFEFVQRLMNDLNDMLLEGFQLKLHPRGSNLEEVMRIKRL